MLLSIFEGKNLSGIYNGILIVMKEHETYIDRWHIKTFFAYGKKLGESLIIEWLETFLRKMRLLAAPFVSCHLLRRNDHSSILFLFLFFSS
jgi:hypothetical protein